MIPDFPTLNPKLLVKSARFIAQSNPLSPYNGLNVQFLHSGRSAIWHAVKILDLSPESNILVPSYHCSVEVDAVLQAGAKIKFYNVGVGMELDLADIQKCIDSNTRGIFIIHYFGFPQPVRELKRFCEDRDLFLIEDCAHSFLSSVHGQLLGTFGDLSVLSLQKSLPLPDGGALITNNERFGRSLHLTAPPPISVVRSVFLRILKYIEFNHAKFYGLVGLHAVHLMRKLFSRVKTRGDLEIANAASATFNLSSVNLSMSEVSKGLLGNFDLAGIALARRANYQFLLGLLSDIPKVGVCFSFLPQGICPCFLPVRVLGRTRLQTELLKQGISTFIFGKKLHRDLPQAGFESARDLSARILGLPIHQDLGKVHLEYMASVLREIMGKY
jgi:perosamine synthetase